MKYHFRSLGLIERIRHRTGFVTFSEVADQTSEMSSTPRYAWACELAQPVTGRRVIDVGCWTGGLLKLFSSYEADELVGIDVTGPWLPVAEKMVPSANFFGVANLEELPIALKGRFDVVIFLETLEHLPRGTEGQVLCSLASLLAPEGTLILSTPAAGLAALLDPAWFLVGHRHYRLATLIELLKSADLEAQGIQYSGNFWSSVDTIMLYIAKHIFRKSYSSPTMTKARIPSGLYERRRPGSANIWVEARRREGGS